MTPDHLRYPLLLLHSSNSKAATSPRRRSGRRIRQLPPLGRHLRKPHHLHRPDGVWETFSAAGEQFGKDRVKKFLAEHADCSADELKQPPPHFRPHRFPRPNPYQRRRYLRPHQNHQGRLHHPPIKQSVLLQMPRGGDDFRAVPPPPPPQEAISADSFVFRSGLTLAR